MPRKLGNFPPPFSFWRAKKKMAVEPSKEKTLIAAQLRARDAPCRAAGRGPKPFCSINAVPARVRAGLLAGYRTWYAVLNKEVIGQRLNLTSDYPRAFRFAKRCPGSRGAVPPFLGWSLRRFPPIPRGCGRGRFAARRLAWVVDWVFRRGRRPRRPEFPSIVKRTDSHIGPLLGTTCVAPVGRGDHTPPSWIHRPAPALV